MNEIKKALTLFFTSRPTGPKELEQHGLDNDGPALRNRPADTGNAMMSNAIAAGTSQQDTPRAATRPDYKDAPPSSSGQVRQQPMPTSAPLISARMFYDAVKAGDLAAVQKCIEQKVDLSSLTPKPETPVLVLALMGRNLPILHLLLPISSHADKLEALLLATGRVSGQRNALKPGVMAILDSANRENKSGPAWESQQKEIDFMSKLLSQWK